jgi:hypothetical protein
MSPEIPKPEVPKEEHGPDESMAVDSEGRVVHDMDADAEALVRKGYVDRTPTDPKIEKVSEEREENPRYRKVYDTEGRQVLEIDDGEPGDPDQAL